MQKLMNEAGWDRPARVVIGLVLIAAWLMGFIAGALGIVAGVVGAVLLVTGLVGVCPLYLLAKFRTNKA